MLRLRESSLTRIPVSVSLSAAMTCSSVCRFVVVPKPDVVWAVDFMSDTLYSGRRFRTLNILDEGVRESLAIEVDTSLPAERVVRVLEQVGAWRGQPQAIRLDNGPELIAERFMTRCAEQAIELRYKRWLRLFGQILPVHKWRLAVRAYAAEGCAGRFSQYTRSGVRPSSARCGLI